MTAWRHAKPADHYRAGLCVGRSDIVQGGIHFRFYEEVFFLSDEKLAVAPFRPRKCRNYLLAKIADVRSVVNG